MEQHEAVAVALPTARSSEETHLASERASMQEVAAKPTNHKRVSSVVRRNSVQKAPHVEKEKDLARESSAYEMDSTSISHAKHLSSTPPSVHTHTAEARKSSASSLVLHDDETDSIDIESFSDRISTRSSTPDTDNVPTPTLEKDPHSLYIDHSSKRNSNETTESDRLSLSPHQEPTSAPVSPLDPNDAHHLSMDSMTSITLSESSLDYDHLSAKQVEDVLATPRVNGIGHRRKPSSLDIVANRWANGGGDNAFFDNAKEAASAVPMSAIEGERDVWARESLDFGAHARSHALDTDGTHSSISLPRESLDDIDGFRDLDGPRRESDGSDNSDGPQVDWQALDKTEEQEKEDKSLPEGAEDESTAFLLARLERENAKFTADPKTPVNKAVARARANSVRPSVNQLKRLVSQSTTPSIRYSFATDAGGMMPEEPPPMTELEFWTALVQDYPSTAARLPTLTTTKIRAGIPPPLRGVVWTSISGARDQDLEDAYEKLLGEKSPYEGIINKDVGRSFPGVELFRDAEGEGQKMLGRVLKCFSLQDKDIGYCQGLGFLVGPLLMNMGERDSFCVLTRLMDHYSLRPSFLPSLSGLHMRIFQFSSLLKQHHPKLHAHLSELGVEPAYLSQWFLSCFAVTCPLQMLFRIYDVIFVEGANETVMRVALALMRRHEERMLGCNEFEEIMQLLLGREIWDCYGGDADLLVDDFTSLGEIVTFSRLAELERDFETKSSETVGQSAGFLPDVQAAASRFLGRLWAPGHVSTPSKQAAHATKPSLSTLSPPSNEGGALSLFGRQASFLRRTASKQSITLNTDNSSSEDSASSGGSLASTAPTEAESSSYIDANGILRESMADSLSMKSKAESIMPQTPGFREQQELHGQIEDLLTALSEMQREHAQLAAMLQREREDRNEDHNVMRQLMAKLRKDGREDRRKTLPPPVRQRIQAEEGAAKGRPLSVGTRRDVAGAEPEKPKDEMEDLVDKLQGRLQTSVRFSANLETKAQLRSNLARAREQLSAAEARSRDLTVRLESTESAMNAFQTESEDLRAEVKELRTRVNDDFKARQKLEHQLAELKAQARSIERKERRTKAESLFDVPALLRTETSPDGRLSSRKSSVSSLPGNAGGGAGGLRELKLVRRSSASIALPTRSTRNTSPYSSQHADGAGSPSRTPALALETGSPAIDASPTLPFPMSPADSVPTSAATPISSGLIVPPPGAATGFARRTSSLATQEVFATTQLEPVPEDALLLELVNSKTAEAQARQDVDELKRALAIGKRKQDEALAALRAELDAARADAQRARAAEQNAQRQLSNATGAAATAPPTSTTSIFSLPSTPFSENGASTISSVATTPADEAGPGSPSIVATPPPSAPAAAASSAAAAVQAGVGWFWNRRTPSTNAVPVVAKEGP